jgi:hypothetical protein
MTFDKMKIISNINYISNIDTNKFIAHTKNNQVLYYKYQQQTPFSLIIVVDYQHKELSIEFTGKILLEKYPNLINAKTIRECFYNINHLGICNINVEAIINQSYVTKCDVTKDIATTGIATILANIRPNISNNKKWVVKGYKGGLTIEKVVSTSRYKERLVIYDKAKEMQRAENDKFLNCVSNAQDIVSYFQGKVRFEVNINTMSQIRTLLNIPNNDLKIVLSATSNPILTVINEAIKYNKPQHRKQTIREYERELLLKSCNYDIVNVEALIRSLSSSNTSIKRVMQPYKDLLNRLMVSPNATSLNLRDLVA